MDMLDAFAARHRQIEFLDAVRHAGVPAGRVAYNAKRESGLLMLEGYGPAGRQHPGEAQTDRQASEERFARGEVHYWHGTASDRSGKQSIKTRRTQSALTARLQPRLLVDEPDDDEGRRQDTSILRSILPRAMTTESEALPPASAEIERLVTELEQAEAYEQKLRQLIVEARDALAAGEVERALSMLNTALSDIDSATDVVVPSQRMK
jgi:hypothetical protein